MQLSPAWVVRHGSQPVVEPVGIETVFQTLQAAVSLDDPRLRHEALAQLQAWERTSAPGYAGALATIMSSTADVQEDTRLLAAVTLKNVVGGTFRKSFGSREWTRVPEHERAFVRSALEKSLVDDPSERVALQTAMTIANVARFDFPSRWPGVLTFLTTAARWSEPGTSPAVKLRALRSLKHVAVAISGARVVSTQQPGAPTRQGGPPAHVREAQEVRQQGSALFAALAAEWIDHAAAWGARAPLAVRCLQVLRTLFRLLSSIEAPELRVMDLMTAFVRHVQVAVEAPPPDAISQKHFRVITECLTAAIENHPTDFAQYLAPFVLAVTRGVLALPQDVMVTDPKRAHAMTRFLTSALLCPAYRRAPPPGADAAQVSPEPPSAPPDPGDLHALTGQHQTEQERAREARAAEAAEAAFAPLFEGDGLVQTLIERFLVPTREELDEWECDPAALLASREPAVAPGGEADSPRPCAELLLTCLLLRKPPAVSAAVLRAAEEARALLSQPAASPAESAARVLVLDGAYRAIGVLSHELPKASVSFPQWFTGELRPMLDAHAARAAGGLPPPGTPAWAAALPERLLCARGLWLIGRFCDDVAEDPKALELVVPVVLQHLGPADPLLALQAAGALRELCMRLHGLPWRVRSERVAPWGMDALSRCFALLPAVGEPESMTAVLHLVALLVELLGRRHLAKHAAAIANAVPPVWEAVSRRAGGEPGASARLHSALLSAATHLCSILGTAALTGAQGGAGAVLFPLIAHATDPSGPQRDYLAEDGMRLWLAALRASVGLSDHLLGLQQRLFDVLRGDPSQMAVLALQGYILIGGRPWVEQHAAAAAAVLGPLLLLTDRDLEGVVLASAAAVEISIQTSPQLVTQAFAPILGEAFQRLAMMNNEAGALAQPHAQDVLPTASVGKAYGMLLSRVVLHCGPARPLELLDGHGALEAWAVAVMVELGGVRYLEDMFARPDPGLPTKGLEERVLTGLAAACLLDAGRESAWGCVGAVVALCVEAVCELGALRGDERAQEPLPLPPPDVPDAAADDNAGPLEQEEGALPNQVDAQARRLAEVDPLHTLSLFACTRGALAKVRALKGGQVLQTQLAAEERLQGLGQTADAVLASLLAQ